MYEFITIGTRKKLNYPEEDPLGSLAVEENNLGALSLEKPHLFVSGLNSLPKLASLSFVTKNPLYLSVQFLFFLIRVFKR